jgi:hypothetical protein
LKPAVVHSPVHSSDVEKRSEVEEMQTPVVGAIIEDSGADENTVQVESAPSQPSSSSKGKPKLEKLNRRSYKEVVAGENKKAEPKVGMTAPPVSFNDRKLVTIDFHGVLDAENGQCTTDTLSALHHWAESYKYRVIVLSYIGRDSWKRQQETKAFVEELQNREKRIFGHTVIQELVIIFKKTGDHGKAEWIKDHNVILHVDDSKSIIDEIQLFNDKHKLGVTPVWIANYLPARMPRGVLVDTSFQNFLYEQIDQLRPDYDAEKKIAELERAQWQTVKPKKRRR